MKRMHRKHHHYPKKTRRHSRKQLSFLEALRLYEGMPVMA